MCTPKALSLEHCRRFVARARRKYATREEMKAGSKICSIYIPLHSATIERLTGLLLNGGQFLDDIA